MLLENYVADKFYEFGYRNLIRAVNARPLGNAINSRAVYPPPSEINRKAAARNPEKSLELIKRKSRSLGALGNRYNPAIRQPSRFPATVTDSSLHGIRPTFIYSLHPEFSLLLFFFLSFFFYIPPIDTRKRCRGG